MRKKIVNLAVRGFGFPLPRLKNFIDFLLYKYIVRKSDCLS